jgi:hypothetical protein
MDERQLGRRGACAGGGSQFDRGHVRPCHVHRGAQEGCDRAVVGWVGWLDRWVQMMDALSIH